MDSLKSPSRAASGHLPSFLLGETESFGFADSPSKGASGGGNLNTSPKDVEMTLAGSTSPQPYTPTSRQTSYSRAAKPMLSGPPILSLYDDLDGSMSELQKENQLFDKSMLGHPQSTHDGEGHWVMVYGFPPSASGHVLSLFSQIGTVVESSFPTLGNWLFIKYATRSDARKALASDARVINSNIMIGVREGKHLNQMRAAYPSTPTLHSSSTLNLTTDCSPGGILSPRIRSLATPRRSLSVQQSLDTSLDATKSSPAGVVTKAMDLLFGGW